MNFYNIESPINSGGDVININDPKGRISSYFIWGEGDGNFLNFMTPQGTAQSGIRETELCRCDFIPTNIGVPVFSDKAREEIDELKIQGIEWNKIVIECKGKKIDYNLCKVNVLLDLVDEKNSTFRVLSGGERLLSKVVYKSDLDIDFMIARDINYKERVVASDNFVQFCKAKGLNIMFSEVV